MNKEIYSTNPAAPGMSTHLYRKEDIEAATVVGGVTDEPVKSICGQVRAFGPFKKGVPEGTCGNCKSKLPDDDD